MLCSYGGNESCDWDFCYKLETILETSAAELEENQSKWAIKAYTKYSFFTQTNRYQITSPNTDVNVCVRL